jgi:CheY-like chemotaxis protein
LPKTWCDRSKIANSMIAEEKQLVHLKNSDFFTVNGDFMEPPLLLAGLNVLVVDDMEPPLLLAGLNILVVDDDDDSRFYVTTVLEADGANVVAVASAATAWEALIKQQPEVLVCDIAMPDEDGYSLIRKVRSLKPDQGGHIPAVALTAYADSEDRIRAMEAGFQTHVGKPVDPTELVEIIAHLVATCRS